MYFLGLGPLLWLISCTGLIYSWRSAESRPSLTWAAIQATVLTSLWCVLGTELLSLIQQLRFVPVLLWWLLPASAMLAAVWHRREGLRFEKPRVDSAWDWMLLGGILAILVVTGFIAATTPPNNYDSQEYHLPRQFMWKQQGHVGTFAANDERQLSMPPFAEFAGTHLLILTEDDRWLNCVQWLALVFIALTVGQIAKTLGASRRGQLLAALFAVSYPTAALQTLNTKNDVVTALFVCIAALFAALILRERKCSWVNALLLGSAIGLAMLTKGTGMLFVIPISLFAGTAILFFHRSKGVLIGAAITIVVVAINFGHFSRNYAEFKSIFGRSEAKGGYPLRNTVRTPAALLSNLSRNTAMHLTVSERSDLVVSNAVALLHNAIGFDINDRRTTFGANKFAVDNPYRNSADQSRAPLHVLLGFVAFCIVCWPKRGLPLSTRLFCLLPFVAFAVFCFEVKWQVWHNRLHIPIFCLLAPVIALSFNRFPVVCYGVAVALFWGAFPLVISNDSKPLRKQHSIFRKSPDEIRLCSRPDMLPALNWLAAVCGELKPKTVALKAHPNCWVYPVQRVVASTPTQPEVFMLRPIFGKRFAITNEVPDLVVAVDEDRFPKQVPKLAHASGAEFFLAAECANLRVYLPAEKAANFSLWPPFHGWKTTEGLSKPCADGVTKISLVCFGKAPCSKLQFESQGGTKEFVFSVGPNGGQVPVAMEFALNQQVLHSCVLTNTEFQDITLPLPQTRTGTNLLEIRYAQTTGKDPVVYKRLQIK